MQTSNCIVAMLVRQLEAGWAIIAPAPKAFASLPALLLVALTATSVDATTGSGCLHCHAGKDRGFAAAHATLAEVCTSCHAGDQDALSQAQAHQGLIAFPGDMQSASVACADCHADKVAGVANSVMHTGAGMIATTRETFGESTDGAAQLELANLAHSPADSLLRKQCASCHLGQMKQAHRLDATRDRGGGCLACHINSQASQEHPALTAQVSDARCFGCHSRSARISLSYAGLAETADTSAGQLPDGRHVRHRPNDRHHAAGMACIDCHTERDLMGIGAIPGAEQAGSRVDISCDDCHRITRTIDPAAWPHNYRALLSRIPYPLSTDSRIPVTRNGTPLWHIELQGQSAWLHRKSDGHRLLIPPYTDAAHPLQDRHVRLACVACHSQWAPQCFGCHLQYDPDGQQFDHVDQKITAGRWTEHRSDIRAELPSLGVDPGERIVPVVPGMIMTVVHPDWAEARFVRRFAAISPHTTGPARPCASCHRDAEALGLGAGRLEQQADGALIFEPAADLLGDGLPADAWTRPGGTGETGLLRPFSRQEMERILAAPLAPPYGDKDRH